MLLIDDMFSKLGEHFKEFNQTEKEDIYRLIFKDNLVNRLDELYLNIISDESIKYKPKYYDFVKHCNSLNNKKNYNIKYINAEHVIEKEKLNTVEVLVDKLKPLFKKEIMTAYECEFYNTFYDLLHVDVLLRERSAHDNYITACLERIKTRIINGEPVVVPEDWYKNKPIGEFNRIGHIATGKDIFNLFQD